MYQQIQGLNTEEKALEINKMWRWIVQKGRNFNEIQTVSSDIKTRFIRRILVASNAIKTIDNEMINLTIKLHYLLFELHSTRAK
jgi:hypothetical protein